LTIVVFHVSRQQGQSLLHVGQFGSKFGCRIDRRPWRLKRAGLEVAIIEGAVKPNPKLPSHLEASQRLCMVTVAAVRGCIAVHANLVEQVKDVRRIVCFNAKPP
jgi:hypothetical protein